MTALIYCYGDGKPCILGGDNLNDADRGALLTFLTSLSPIRVQHQVRGSAASKIDRIIQQVAELPDRTSPDDWPEAMLVTADELRSIFGGVVAGYEQRMRLIEWWSREE